MTPPFRFAVMLPQCQQGHDPGAALRTDCVHCQATLHALDALIDFGLAHPDQWNARSDAPGPEGATSGSDREDAARHVPGSSDRRP